MTELNHKTFDLGAVLSGLDFPETEVKVYLDERVGFEIYQAREALRQAEIRGNEEALAKIAAELDALEEKKASSAYKVTVRGIPESTRKACDAKARKEYPVEYNFMGQATPSPERDDLYNLHLWRASLVKFEDPSGAYAVLSEELVKQLREEAGRSVFRTIADAIQELQEGVTAGFEDDAKGIDFLSEA